jgi:hypothetical protein
MDTNLFLPTDHTAVQSRWAADHVVGAAVCGLAALVLEEAYGLPEFMPTRLTVDLFKSPRRVRTTTSMRLLWDDRRTRNSLCVMEQEGVAVAQAVLVQYRRDEALPGRECTPDRSALDTPALTGLAPQNGSVRQMQSGSSDWTAEIADHQNADRKRVFTQSVDVLAGKGNTPFVQAVTAAEATSLVTNLGTAGVGYINGDLTVALSRLPDGGGICVQAESHWVSDGITVGTATLLDGSGAFGSGLVTALSNRHAQIDFSS